MKVRAAGRFGDFMGVCSKFGIMPTIARSTRSRKVHSQVGEKVSNRLTRDFPTTHVIRSHAQSLRPLYANLSRVFQSFLLLPVICERLLTFCLVLDDLVNESLHQNETEFRHGKFGYNR